jgi:hypothetical protein
MAVIAAQAALPEPRFAFILITIEELFNLYNGLMGGRAASR